MKNRPPITVIVPVFNAADDFPHCIESVIEQTYSNLQIIVVDDGSNDGSSNLIDKIALCDNRIIAIHQKNRGVSAARNRGLEIASGDYYHFPDGDDYLELDAYEYCLAIMREHDCDAVNFEHWVTYVDHEIAHQLSIEDYGLKDCAGARRLLFSKAAFACNKLYSAKLVEGLRFHEDIFRGEDSLFAHQALTRAKSVWFDSRPLYHYVQNQDSACRGAFRESQLSALKLPEVYAASFPDNHEYKDYANRFMTNLSITLYYDMWADKKDWRTQQAETVEVFSRCYRETKGSMSLSRAAIIKYRLFAASPSLYCRLHEFRFGRAR